MSFDGKVALITGANRGIGNAILHTLAQQGAYVIGTATTEDGAAHITHMLHAASLHGEGLCLDVTEHDQVTQVCAHLADNNKSPAILVNNAGITRDNLLLRMDDEEWYKVIETNLNAIYWLTKACLKAMLQARWGRIISVGSIIGSSGNSGQVNYAAAKAGVIGFTKSLAQEVGSRHITVNVVSPGFIDTDMTRALPDAVKAEILKRIPLKRLGTANDVAAVVAFLASDVAEYITGQTLHVNGGMYMD